MGRYPLVKFACNGSAAEKGRGEGRSNLQDAVGMERIAREGDAGGEEGEVCLQFLLLRGATAVAVAEKGNQVLRKNGGAEKRVARVERGRDVGCEQREEGREI